jgi:molecular chaperone GrpE
MEKEQTMNQETEIKEENLEYTSLEMDLNTKLIESEDKYLRLFAEFENYKKRVQKDKEDIRIATKTNMLSSILDLDSDLAIAMKNSKGDNEGLKLIMSKLERFLNNQGVESIQTDTYDADLHEVISVLEVGEEKIVDVVSKGYTINGKPFRYPKIILGK